MPEFPAEKNRARQLFVGLWIIGLAVLAAMGAGLLFPHPLVALIIVLGLCVTIAIGVMSQSCGFFAQPINRVAMVPSQLALTFDDGPDAKFTPPILDLLARFGQKATFFVVGEKVVQYPELARRILAEGHEIGNHTMSHPWHLALWSAKQIAEELSTTTQLIERVTGQKPRLFRPPAAMLSPRIATGAQKANLTLVGFSVRSGDGSPLISARRALERLRGGLADGAILVLHDAASPGRTPVALEVLPELLQEMNRRRMRSVPLSNLLERASQASRNAR